jgi:branched-chain amino acid transport system ATP-binding protein
MSRDIALALDGVTRTFGGVTAISSVSLEVPTGVRYGIIGPNGAGKTTLFNLISGELSVTDGRIELFGENVTHARPARRVRMGLGRTYQITRTFRSLTVAENLALSLHGLRRSKYSMLRSWKSFKALMREGEEVAERFGLHEKLSVPASELSHGEMRELEVALTLALKPSVLLLDEPGAGLSPGERVSMRALLRSVPADLTLVMIEHDMDLVREVVDMVTVLNFGEVVTTGRTGDVQRDPTVQEIYLGSHGDRGHGPANTTSRTVRNR